MFLVCSPWLLVLLISSLVIHDLPVESLHLSFCLFVSTLFFLLPLPGDRISDYIALASLTHYVDQVGLKDTAILLPLPTEF